ncbi:DUF4942 domain-containing protein [Klebsiella pneumoniae]
MCLPVSGSLLNLSGKGSAHVTFTRPDLVDKINEIVASRYPDALPSRV